MTGRTRVLLFIAALCLALSWHPSPSPADILGRPHDLNLANPKGHCLNCHDPHQPNLGAGFAHTLKRPNEITVCYQCHAGSQNNYSSIDPSLKNVTALLSFYNIRSEFNQTNIHFPNFGMDGEVNKCSECHNPHGVLLFNPNSTIVLTSANKGSTINDAVGNTIEVDLSVAADGGYQWFTNGLDASKVQVTGHVTIPPPPPPIGGMATDKWYFMPLSSGSTTISMLEYRSWEGPGNAIDSFNVTLSASVPTRKPKLLSAGQDAVTDTDDYCLVCHNSDSNPPHRPFSNISVRGQFKFSRATYKKMEHSTFFRWSTANEPVPDTAHTYDDNPYGKGKDISCLTCHRPHGSPNQYMLKSSNDQNFCLACHKGGVVFGLSVPPLGTFTTSGHGRTNLGSNKRICQDCHFPHGTGQKHAVYRTLTDPHTGNNNLVNISSLGMNSACYACHGSRSSSGYYTGPAYNSSIHKTSPNALNPYDTNGQAAGDCDNCHDPHGVFGNYSKMTVARKENLCYECHAIGTPNTADGRNITAEFQMSSRHNLTKVTCKNCHNAHTVTPSSTMMNPFHPASTISDNKTFCLMCHSGTMPAGVTGAYNIVTGVFKKWTNNGHDRQHVLACSDCHSSHGSPNAKTLNYKTLIYNGYSAPFGSRTGLSFNKRKFCEVCHNHRGTVGYKGASTIQAGANYATAHSPSDTTPCSNCHKFEHNPLLTSYTGIPAYYNIYCLNCHAQGTGAAYPNVESEFNYPNRVVNSGMEGSLTGWTASAWAPAGLTTPVLDTTIYHGGATSVKLTTSANKAGDNCLYGSRIAVRPSTSYTFSGWVYVTTALTGSVTVGGLTGPYTTLCTVEWDGANSSNCVGYHMVAPGVATTSGQWVYITYTWTTSATTKFFEPRLEVNGVGTVWWDDISLVPAGVTPLSVSTHALTYSPSNSVPPSTNDCTVCHGTHSNLTAANDVVDPNPAYLAGQSLNSTSYNAFCLKCHGTSPVNIGGQAPPNIINAYTSAGHGMASLTSRVLCTQCHEHHGSAYKKLVKKTISNSAVSSNYSGINISTCTVCHKGTDRNLAFWPGSSVYSGSVHAFGNTSTGNLVKDGTHGPGVCDNCHNPHGVRVDGTLAPFMAYKEGENLCYRCHASGFDNFSTAGDYNDRWDHFGTVLSIAKQKDAARMALHVGQSGGQSIAQNVAVWDGLVSSNTFPDSDSVITVQLKVANYTFKNGQLMAGLRLEDVKSSSNAAPSSSNYIGVFYNMTTSAASAWRSAFSSGQYSGNRTVSGGAASYTALKIVRKKAFGTFSSYAGSQSIVGGRFTSSGYFKVRLYAYVSGNKNALPEALEAWFDNFNVQYTGSGATNLAHNTSSGDDVQARFSMTTHHKVADYDQTDGSKVECTDCHDPHTITEKLMGYQNTSGVSGKSVQAVVADQIFCLKCHNANWKKLNNGVFFPRTSNTVWNKLLFYSSAHGNPLKRYKTLQPGQTFLNYENGVYYVCKVCHNPHGSNQAHLQRESWDINRDGIPDDINGDGILDSSTQVGFIGYSTDQLGNIVRPRKVILVNTMAGMPSRSTFKRISTTIPVQANGAIDVMLCLVCHSGRPAPDVKSEFAKVSHHDVTFADQTAHGGSKIECYNCHDQHRAQARNDAAGEYPTTNPTGFREPMAGDAAFCLKCHNTDNGNPPSGVSNLSFGKLKLKNIKLSYNPNNYVDSKGYDIITSAKQGHFVQSTGKPMMCRDCHNQHGSNYQKMLRDDTNTDPTQPIQNMRPVALWPSDPFSGGDSTPLSSTAERCLSCHSGGTTYNGNLIPIPPPPTPPYTGFTSLPEVGKHPDVKPGMSLGNGLTTMNGHLYSSTFAVSTTTGSVKDVCTTCHDSHKPYIRTVDDELTDCYNCHNANTSLPDVQTEFDANPLNSTRSKSYHPIKYDPTQPSGVECMKCHDQAKHMQGWVRLRKDPSHSIDSTTNKFINFTSDTQVWVSQQKTSGGYVNDGTLPFANSSTMIRFCTECHDRSSTRKSDFNGHNPPTMSFNIMSGAHFTNGRLVCTNCHEYHGSVSTVMKKNSFATNYEPTPTAQTQSLEGAVFCYGCHVNKANSNHGIDIQFKFMSTASHHLVGASEQAASGKPSNGSRLTCKNCHNMHIITRAMPVTYGNLTTTLAHVDAAFCISCHNGAGAAGVKFPGYTTGSSGAEWDPVTGAWNMWNKQSYTSSLHTTRGSMTCGKCHDSHGSSNYRLLLTNVSSASGSARNIKVGFGVHSTLRGKRTEEIGVNGVCGACHKNTMGIYTGYTVYPGYASYTSQTFGRKSGIDKNCTYCHNPHGTSQTKFGNDTSGVARMMRANKPLYMNMTSKNYGGAYNFKKSGGFSNSTTGAPYYAFCSSRGCHASEKTAGNTFTTATEKAKPLYDTFSQDLPLDNFNKYATSSSHHPIKEGTLACTSCHKEHGTSTKTTDYLKPDLRAPYFRASNWPLLWHGGIGLYESPPQTPGNYNGDHGWWGTYNDYSQDGGAYFNGANYFEASASAAWRWNSSRAPRMTNMTSVASVTPPSNANDLCYMCHYKTDIIGIDGYRNMSGTNTRFLGHEAVAGGAKMSHQISPDTTIPASGEYHKFSCSTCHFPHATTQNRLVKVSCLSQLDNETPQTGTENGAAAMGSTSNNQSPKEASIFKCHAYTSYRHGSGGTVYRGWRNLTTAAKTIFSRPKYPVTTLAETTDQTLLTVTLNWTAVAQSQGVKADHYNVYRSTQPITQDTKPYATRISKGTNGSGGNIIPTPVQMTYLDKWWLLPNTKYYYVVVACDSNNNESFISNCVCASLGPDQVPPNAISTQQLSQPDGTYNVKITWNDPGDNVNVLNYRIYKKVDTSPTPQTTDSMTSNDISFGSYSTVSDTLQSSNGNGYNTGDPNTYTYTTKNLTQGTWYTYAVIAADSTNMANGFNLPTALTFSIKVQNPAPSPVTTLTAVPVTKSMSATLNWGAPTNKGITSYNVYRKTSVLTQSDLGGTGSANYIGSTDGTTLTYTDTTLPLTNTNYYYAVTAVNANATSAYQESLLGNVAGPVNIPQVTGFSAYSTSFNSGFIPLVGAQAYWTAPANTTGLSNYRLYWRPTGGSSWTAASANSSSPRIARNGNLASNGGMESNLSGWSSNGLTAASDTTTFHSGAASAKLTAATSGDKFLYATSLITVSPSTAYTYSGWVYVPAAITGGANIDGVSGPYTALRVIEKNSSQVNIAEHESQVTAVSSTNGCWVYVSDSWTTNSSTAYIQPLIELQGVGTAWWDDIALTPSLVTATNASLDCTGLQPGSYDLYATALYGSYEGATNYESPISGISTFSVSDTATPGGFTVTGALSANPDYAALSWAAPSDNIGLDHYVISANYGSGWGTIINSLLSNPGFETFTGTADDGVVDTFTGWGASNTNMYAVTDGLFDSYAAQIVYTGSGDNYIYQPGPTGSSVANQPYSMSFWAKANKPTTFQYYIQENGGGWQWIGTQSPSIGTRWQRFTASGTFSSAATATSARVVIRPSGDTTAAITIDGVRLCTGTEALNADEGTFYSGAAQSFTDINVLPAGGSGKYRVWAVDAKGNYSPAGTAMVNARPTAITDLNVASSTTTTANVVTWSEQSSQVGLYGYKVYANGTQIGTVTPPGCNNCAGNLASQAAASSTTTYSGSPSYVNDNNTSTYWYGSYTGPDNLTLTFVAAEPIAKVSFNFYYYGYSYYIPKNFLIQTWNGSAWVTQVTVTGNSSTNPTYYFPAPVSTTRVQIYITDTVGYGGVGISSYFPIVSEFYVYAGESFPHTPSNAYLPAVVGHSYTYTAIAEDLRTPGVDSAISNSVAHTLTDADSPAPVSNLVATLVSGTSNVALSWSMPTDNIGATQFKIYRSPAACYGNFSGITNNNYTKTSLVAQIGGTGSYGVNQPPTNTIWYTDTTLCDGSKAYYAVSSGDAANNWSAVSNNQTVTTRPSKIINLSAVFSNTTTENVLSWSKPASYAGLLNYKIYRAKQSTPITSFANTTTLYTITTNLNASSQTYTDGPLSNQVGTTYAYAVVARDVNGLDSLISNSPVITVVDRDRPAKITDLSLSSPVGTTQVNLTWSKPLDNVGVTQYQVYRLPTSLLNTPAEVTDGNYATATLLGTSNTNSYTDNTWYDGYGAYYAVRSRDAAGNWSRISSSATTPYIIVGQDSTPPTAPTITGITVAPSPELDINWTASSDPDDSVSGYALYRADAAFSNFTGAKCITSDNIGYATTVCSTIPYYYTQWADTGGTPGHTYYYALRAYDTAAPQNWSSLCTGCCASATVAITATVTSKPTWTSPTPLTVTGYTLVQYPDIDLNWTAASDSGQGQAGAVDHYTVYRSKQSFSSFAGISSIATVSGLKNSYIDHRGIAGTTYYYGIVAVDASTSQLVSDLSNVASATVGPEPCSDSGKNQPTTNNIPTVPTHLAAPTGAYPLINLSWNASTDLDDCGNVQPFLQYYRLYYAASGVTIPDDAHNTSKYPTEESLNVIGVYTMMLDNQLTTYPFRGTGGNRYNFRVEAYDMAGNYSGLSSPVTGQVDSAPCSTSAKPTVPALFTAIVGPAPDMDFTWSASAVGGCSGSNLIDHYNLYRKLCTDKDAQGNLLPSITVSTVLSSITPIRISGSSTSCIDTTGSPSTTYSYVLTAVDSQGNESGMSTIITKATEADTTPPASINDLHATVITGGIQITWCKPSDNVGVTGYDIYRVAQGTIMQDYQIGSGNKIYTSNNTGKCVTYNDTSVTSGTTYSYAVIAVDGAGNRSSISAGAHAGDTICQAP